MTITKEIQVQWLKGIILNHIGHNLAASYYKAMDRALGLGTTVLTAIVSTTLFASLSSTKGDEIVLIAGIISLLASIISAAYGFLKYGELSEQHRQSAKSYGTIRRDFELLLLNEPKDDIIIKMSELNAKRDQYEDVAPVLPERIYNKALESASTSNTIKTFTQQ